ncbi:MAG: hypothetical protein IH971_05535 [Candidatus Marinimicrobia bacterium]|nr:hypothetical protein [Candidatus Neomarinimicrobiota bacterium]
MGFGSGTQRAGRKTNTLIVLALLAALGSIAVLAGRQPPQTPQPPISFHRTFGGPGEDEGSSVHQTSDGGYIVAGVTSPQGGGARNVWLLKVGAGGAEEWSRTFDSGPGYYEGGEALQMTTDGGYVIVGATLNRLPSDYDIRLIRTNGNGRQLWTRTYGGNGWDWGGFVSQTGDGGFIITGWTDSQGSGGGDLWLVKTDAQGEEEWTRTYGGIENEQGNCVQPTPDGGYIVTGATSSNSVGEDDLWLIKTDAKGVPSWMRVLGGSGFDEGHFVALTTDRGYIVVGSTTSFGSGKSDVWLIKLDSAGRVAWTKTFGGSEWDWGNAVHETPDGGYIIVGTTLSFGAGESDIWLIKTDREGEELWSRTYGGDDLEFGLSVQPAADGGYIIAGRTYSFGAGASDLLLIKTDAAGQALN